ncbi:hypothetical protein GCM10023235_78200 [Kitasatospora terrestris]|uniref:Uncharacterized protein n=1 Tax=Kitasatospora terrestris TaxID=258051 RepID=A0ABP9ERF9_9ACTN
MAAPLPRGPGAAREVLLHALGVGQEAVVFTGGPEGGSHYRDGEGPAEP